MIILAYILSGLSLLMSVLLLIQTRFPLGFFVMIPKAVAAGLSPYWAITGAVGALIGWGYQAYWVVPIGVVGAGLMTTYVWRCTRNHDGLKQAFGDGWADLIPPEHMQHIVQKRWRWFLKMKTIPEPSCERDVPFGTIPGTDRQLLCDVWRPADASTVSGLAFIYFHGGAWYLGDKGFLTKPFFHHLVAQGHTVVDVAYRLCPEVDIYGMTGDVKRAIAWMKENASRYDVNPEKIVLGGASAGGQLALLAAYTTDYSELTPEDVKNTDLSVCGVISYYGPTDFLAVYQHTNQQRMVEQDLPSVPIGPDSTMSVQPADWRMDVLLGGWPQDALHNYQLTSPITHVSPDCPPTLLIQGKLDHITPVDATCALYAKLIESGVTAINVVFPWTDHGLDLFFPQLSPANQSALYDADRFLAILLNKEK